MLSKNLNESLFVLFFQGTQQIHLVFSWSLHPAARCLLLQWNQDRVCRSQTQQVRSASVMPKQLCWCTQNWISVPSSRNITANLLCFSLLHYCTVPYSSFFFKPTCIEILYVKLTHFPRATNKNIKIVFQDYWEYHGWQFMGLWSNFPKNNPKTY